MSQKGINLKMYYAVFFVLDASTWFIFLPLAIHIVPPSLTEYALWQITGFGITYAAYEISLHASGKRKRR